MADFSLDDVVKLAESLGGDAGKALTGFVEKMTKAGESSATLKDVLGSISSSVGSATGSAEALSTVLKKIAEQKYNKLKDEISSTDETVSEFATSAIAAMEPIFFNILPRGADAFGDLGKASGIAGSTIVSSFSKVQPILKGILSQIPLLKGLKMENLQAFVQSADDANNLEKNIISLLGASGQLNSVLKTEQGEFKDLSTVAMTFVDTLADLSKGTGTSLDEMMSFAGSVSVIPDMMSGASVSIGSTTESFHSIQAAMTVAAGAGIKNSEAAEILTRAYMDLNISGQSAVELLANISGASKDLGIPLSNVREFTLKAAESFKFFGDNSQAALNVMEAFGPAFKESGLGPAAIQELVGGMTSGIQQMDLAHKAFISGASGGAAGIAGAFEIDLLLQQGKMDEVMKRTMDAMEKQFGGPVVTLEDVGRDKNLAGDLLKQMSFLKDVAGVASSDQQAYKILEAMQKGSPEQLGQVIQEKETTTDQRLQDSFSRGEDLQRRGNTILTEIATNTQRSSAISANINANTLRDMSAKSGVEGRRQTASRKADDRDLVGKGDADEITTKKSLSIMSDKAKETAEDGKNSIIEFVRDMPIVGDFLGDKKNPKIPTAGTPIPQSTAAVATGAISPALPTTDLTPQVRLAKIMEELEAKNSESKDVNVTGGVDVNIIIEGQKATVKVPVNEGVKSNTGSKQ